MNLLSSRPQSKGLYFLVGLCLVGCLSISGEVWAGGEVDEVEADRACRQGLTIYCLALGMAEERTGQKEKAWVHYQLACENHVTPGHLRACTPLLSLSRELGRLAEAAVPLEKRCREGDQITCFYLGKEYLKILEYGRAASHLEPLCRQDFRPPDPGDYGPCYHLAKGMESGEAWSRARELYQFDCERDPERGAPSCAALEALAILQKKMVKQSWSRIRKLEGMEVLILFLVSVPIAGTILWFRGKPYGRWFLRWPAPALVLFFWGLWEFLPKRNQYHPADWILIGVCLFWTLGLAFLALWKNKKTEEKEDDYW